MSMGTTPAPEVVTALSASDAHDVLDHLYRMGVDEYERLADAGCLKDRRVELINGWLVRKMTTKPPHVVAVDATREAVAVVLPPGWWLRDEKPVRIPEFDEPEPDISVVRGSRQDYRTRHPGPGEIEFLVEVADTSLSWDRGPKLMAFARRRADVLDSQPRRPPARGVHIARRGWLPKRRDSWSKRPSFDRDSRRGSRLHQGR